MDKTKWKMLCEVDILQDVTRETMQIIATLPMTYPERNSRYEPKAGELALLLSGQARVCRRDGAKMIPLSRLQKGQCVGLASLCSEDMPDTEISFSGGAALLVIPRHIVEALILEDAMFSRNIIGVLSEKVRFLNTKIAGYTANNGVEKLYRYLQTLPIAQDGFVDTAESTAALARRLGIARVSLYRAIDALAAEGKIYKEGQKYKLLCLENKEELQ